MVYTNRHNTKHHASVDLIINLYCSLRIAGTARRCSCWIRSVSCSSCPSAAACSYWGAPYHPWSSQLLCYRDQDCNRQPAPSSASKSSQQQCSRSTIWCSRGRQRWSTAAAKQRVQANTSLKWLSNSNSCGCGAAVKPGCNAGLLQDAGALALLHAQQSMALMPTSSIVEVTSLAVAEGSSYGKLHPQGS